MQLLLRSGIDETNEVAKGWRQRRPFLLSEAKPTKEVRQSAAGKPEIFSGLPEAAP
jgi:hypothetical protein